MTIMGRLITPFLDRIGAAWSLFRLGWQSRFRMRGAYWTWRNETAFGNGSLPQPTPAEKRRAMWHYAAWVWRMRRHLSP